MKQNIPAMLQQGLRLYQSGQLQQAEMAFREVLKSDQGNVNALQLLGTLLSQQGHAQEGEKFLRKAIKRNNKIPQLHFNLGNNLDIQGKLMEAAASYRSAIKLDPNNEQALSGLGLTLLKQNKTEEAATLLRKAHRINPNNLTTQVNLGHALWRLGEEDDAIQLIKRAINTNPQLVDALALLGGIHLSQGNMAKEAEEILRKAFRLNPNHYETLLNLSSLLLESNNRDDTQEALTLANKLTSGYPQSVDAHYNLGKAKKAIEDYEGAISTFSRAIELDPKSSFAMITLAECNTALGRFDEARKLYNRAKKQPPVPPEVYIGILLLSQSEELPDKDIREIEKIIDNAEKNNSDIKSLAFEYAKYLEKKGDYDKAFNYLARANTQKRQRFEYDHKKSHTHFEKIKSIFDRNFFEQRKGTGIADNTPIFILGMPRSGTSLVEQILASHPQVVGAGELDDLNRLVSQLCEKKYGIKYPEAMISLQNKDFEELGTAYVQSIAERFGNSRRITDKMPQNFILLGIIYCMLPNAKIIHCQRDPVDNCLSIFKQDFKSLHRYAYDLEELAHYYLLYQDLMRHWKEVLPGDYIFNLQYEDLVANQEEMTRKILQFCELPWDEKCLEFHATERAVNTASQTQVRKKIYSDSIKLWRRYENHLTPLINVLKSGNYKI